MNSTGVSDEYLRIDKRAHELANNRTVTMCTTIRSRFKDGFVEGYWAAHNDAQKEIDELTATIEDYKSTLEMARDLIRGRIGS